MRGNVRLIKIEKKNGANWNIQRIWGGAQEIKSRDNSTKNIVLGGKETLRVVIFEFYLIFFFCTDVESDEGIQGQYKMGKGIEAFNTGD